MQARGTPFKGVLYAGLMLKNGAAKLIEYNVRFGDPEMQVLMLRLKSDLLPALLAVAEGRLSGVALDWHDDAALCVVMATRGYPGAYAKGSEIKGLDAAGADPDVQVFHAGTSARARASSPMAAACSASPRGARHSPGAGPRLCGGRRDRLAGRLLPPRHRLARGVAGRKLRPGLRRSNPLNLPKIVLVSSHQRSVFAVFGSFAGAAKTPPARYRRFRAMRTQRMSAPASPFEGEKSASAYPRPPAPAVSCCLTSSS